MRKKERRLVSMIAILTVVLSMIFSPAGIVAAEKVETEKNGKASLTLELPASSDSVKLYQIAEYDSESKIVMKNEAAVAKVTIDSKDDDATLSQKAKVLAETMKAQAVTGKTDAAFKVKFSNLKLGYYLVVVDKCESASAKYEVAPAIISVPATEKSTLKYDVAVKLKSQEIKVTSTPATTTPKAPTSGAETVGTDDDSANTDSGIADSSDQSIPTGDAAATPTAIPSPIPTESVTPTSTESIPAESIPTTPTESISQVPTESVTTTPTGGATTTPTEGAKVSPTVSAIPTGEASVSPTPDSKTDSSIPDKPSDDSSVPDKPSDDSSVSDKPSDDSSVPVTPSDDSSVPVTPADDSSIPDITVTPDPSTWHMSVTKYWIDKNNIPLSSEDITAKALPIQIWKKAAADGAQWEKVQLVNLTPEEKWTYAWEAEDDGATWTVSEDAPPVGFTPLTIKQSKNSTKRTLDFKVTNMSNADVTPAPVQLSVVKYWKDKKGDDISDEEIGVESLPIRIYRKPKGETKWELYEKINLTAETAWEYHWGAAADGADWTVTETDKDVPEGYILEKPIKMAHNAANTKIEFRVTNIVNESGDVTPTPTDEPGPSGGPTKTPTGGPTNTPTTKPKTPTNTPKPSNTISYSVVKKWQSSSGGDLSSSQIGVSSLTVIIYRKAPGAVKYEKNDTIELLPSNNWTHSWTAPNDGSTWTVTEPSIPTGYEKLSITQTKDKTKNTCLFTVTNRKNGSGSGGGNNSNTNRKSTATPRATGSAGRRTSPSTGDDQNIWIPLMTMAGAAFVLFFILKKVRK